ncbi:protein of unknown function [Pararobbsia alpina]
MGSPGSKKIRFRLSLPRAKNCTARYTINAFLLLHRSTHEQLVLPQSPAANALRFVEARILMAFDPRRQAFTQTFFTQCPA